MDGKWSCQETGMFSGFQGSEANAGAFTQAQPGRKQNIGIKYAGECQDRLAFIGNCFLSERACDLDPYSFRYMPINGFGKTQDIANEDPLEKLNLVSHASQLGILCEIRLI